MTALDDRKQRFLLRLVDHIDFPLLAIMLILMGIGFITIFSASQDHGHRVTAQIINLTLALLCLWIVAQIPPRILMRSALPIYLIGVVLLVLVWLIGKKVNGAQRWLDVGIAQFQPAEIMKIAVPLMLAWFFQCKESVLNYRHFIIAAIFLLIPVALIFKQPDLGTAFLVAAAGFFVLFFAGLSWWFILGFLSFCVAIAPFVWTHLHDFQKKRITIFLDPTSDPLGAGYHIIQSTIAIGSGGRSGKGWLAGTQTQLEFLPEKHTDFICAVFAEEWGLMGILVLLTFYLLFFLRALYITVHATTLFTQLLAATISMIFFIYAFVNMGMVTGILPVVGVPLPFISYGGTALIALCIGAGILMSIHTHKHKR